MYILLKIGNTCINKPFKGGFYEKRKSKKKRAKQTIINR